MQMNQGISFSLYSLNKKNMVNKTMIIFMIMAKKCSLRIKINLMKKIREITMRIMMKQVDRRTFFSVLVFNYITINYPENIE